MGSRQSTIEDIETLDVNSISKALSEIDIDEIEARYGGSEEFESAFGLCGNEIGKIESWLGLPNTFVAEDFMEASDKLMEEQALKMDLKSKDYKLQTYQSLIATMLSPEEAEKIEEKVAEKMKEKKLLRNLNSEDSGQGSEDDDSILSSSYPRRYIKSSNVRRGSLIPLGTKIVGSKSSGLERKWRILPALTRDRTKRPGLKRFTSAPVDRQRYCSIYSSVVEKEIPDNEFIEDDLNSIDLNGSFEGVSPSSTKLGILQEVEDGFENEGMAKSVESHCEWKILPKLIMANRPMLHRFVSAPVGIQAFDSDSDDDSNTFLWDYNSVAV